VLEWRRHPGGSRNTVGIRQRLLIRAALVRRHPRFFLHPRAFGWLAGKVAERRKVEVTP
jgi:hypothetical protein